MTSNGFHASRARTRTSNSSVYNPTFDEAVTQPLEFAAGIVCCFSKFNQRMHNKLFLVDGEIGIAGGRNYENRYFDWDQEFDYRDRDVLVLGPDRRTRNAGLVRPVLDATAARFR